LEGLVPAGKRCTAYSYALVWGATFAQCTLVFSLFLLAMALGGLCRNTVDVGSYFIHYHPLLCLSALDNLFAAALFALGELRKLVEWGDLVVKLIFLLYLSIPQPHESPKTTIFALLFVEHGIGANLCTNCRY
jgi:hypothetical protein